MQTDFHLLYPPDYDRNKAVPMKDYKFIHALKIDAMVILIKESYRGVADLSLENFFSTDERVLEKIWWKIHHFTRHFARRYPLFIISMICEEY